MKPAPKKSLRVIDQQSQTVTGEAASADRRQQSPQSNEPILSSDFINAIGVCNLCHKGNQLGVIFGDPGSGKSTAINAFAKRTDNVILFTARVEMSPKDILNELAAALGIMTSGTRYQRVSAIVDELTDRPRMIIVDEGET